MNGDPPMFHQSWNFWICNYIYTKFVALHAKFWCLGPINKRYFDQAAVCVATLKEQSLVPKCASTRWYAIIFFRRIVMICLIACCVAHKALPVHKCYALFACCVAHEALTVHECYALFACCVAQKALTVHECYALFACCAAHKYVDSARMLCAVRGKIMVC